jgi:hypothetical protein
MSGRPMTIELISASFKKEMAVLKADTELKFDAMSTFFQNQLQILLGNQANFFNQMQSEIKSSEKQTRLDLRTLMEDVAEFKSSLSFNQQIIALQKDISKAAISGEISPLTSGSEVVFSKGIL